MVHREVRILFHQPCHGILALISFALLLLTVTACQGHPAKVQALPRYLSCDQQTTSVQEPIINGQALGPEDELSRMSVLISISNEAGGLVGNCSGVLINSHQVITAAHCKIDRTLQEIVFGKPGAKPEFRKVIRTDAMPNVGWVRDILPLGGVYARSDVAVMTFSGKVPEDFHPARLLPEGEHPAVGSALSVVGFGLDELNSSGILKRTILSMTKRERDLLILQDPSGISAACFGDSGGPAFLRDCQGQYWLVSVQSATTVSSDNEDTCKPGGESYAPDFTAPTVRAFLKDAIK